MARHAWSRGKTSGLLHSLRKAREEFVGELLRGPVDEPLSELRQLSADLSLDVVSEACPVCVLVEFDRLTDEKRRLVEELMAEPLPRANELGNPFYPQAGEASTLPGTPEARRRASRSRGSTETVPFMCLLQY